MVLIPNIHAKQVKFSKKKIVFFSRKTWNNAKWYTTKSQNSYHELPEKLEQRKKAVTI